jgi:VIT1/CCC1 family predicted Fe2+/Mn2+ transporter
MATSLAPLEAMVPSVVAASLACLAILGALGARAGGAPVLKSVIRVVFWGALAMAVTAGVGKAFGAAV